MDKGYKIKLEPDKYPKHEKLAMKLRQNPQWEETEPTKTTPRDEPLQVDDEKLSEVILPHQREVIDEIRRNRELLSTSTEQTS